MLKCNVPRARAKELAALLISPGTFHSERMRDQNSLYSLASPPPPSFPLLPFFGLHFLRREWENRLNISEHFRIRCHDTFYLSPPPVSYSISLSRRGWKTYIFRATITIDVIQRAMQDATILILNKRSFNERNGRVGLSLWGPVFTRLRNVIVCSRKTLLV